MSDAIVIVDVSNLAHRAFHTTGELSYEGDGTGVLYGVLRDIAQLGDLFGSGTFAFCFDGGHDVRRKIYSKYKESRLQRRREADEFEQEARRDLRRQIYRLRTRYLPQAGFENIIWQEGFEADDVIAWLVDYYGTDEFVIVSSDHDLLQLLSGDRVVIWSPVAKQVVNEDVFRDRYGIGPSMWSMVKAIAGCNSDGVPGVRGVGEKTAVKYISGNLNTESKKYQDIINSHELIDRNLKLVDLPAEGCGPFELERDRVTEKDWNKLVMSMGMKSLVGRWN